MILLRFVLAMSTLLRRSRRPFASRPPSLSICACLHRLLACGDCAPSFPEPAPRPDPDCSSPGSCSRRELHVGSGVPSATAPGRWAGCSSRRRTPCSERQGRRRNRTGVLSAPDRDLEGIAHDVLDLGPVIGDGAAIRRPGRVRHHRVVELPVLVPHRRWFWAGSSRRSGRAPTCSDLPVR